MSDRDQNRIQSCSVCVIGGAGFLGSHLVEHLVVDRKCDVLVLDNLITGLRKHLHPDSKFVWHDIRVDEDRLIDLLKQHNVEYVFNYAAEPYIPECFERPQHFFDVNAVAVLKVLSACQIAGCTRVLQVSSAEIYGDVKGRISESDPVVPHSTYGVSKMAADNLVQVRWRESATPAIAVRQFNCVGERETHEYVIPEIISQLDRTGPKVQLGNNSKRDFQYAGDAVRMAVRLLETGHLGEVYNMGSERVVAIYDLVPMLGQIMGYSKDEVSVVSDEQRKRPWEIWHLQSDNSKLYSVIGAPVAGTSTTLEKALQLTVEYYRDNGNKWDW